MAIGLARLGVPVCWMGRVGADAFGDEIVRTLRGEGVELRTSRDEERPTGLMVKHRRTPSHQRISYYRAGSAGSALSIDDLDLAAIQAAQVLHITGITLALTTSSAEAVWYAVAAAREAGVVEEMAPAVPVSVVDTVGAGDAFVAGYLSALLQDRPLAERLRRACAVGAFVCTSPGDWEGAPSLGDLQLLTAREKVTR